ncbi:MAG: dephospho-CoA kinase [Rhodospirillaceae bacterium]|nr:dephospho-CoA kinase [Rhodospirillaceae bacterium]
MIVVGLTGSIGMGKSTAAAALRRLGIPVHDADREVHRLYGRGGRAVPLIEKAFPGTTAGGAVELERLRRAVVGNAAALDRLEAIVHPMVRGVERRFLMRAAARRVPIVVLEVPLLFETGGDRRCDAVVVVSAPRRIQLARVLARRGMTRERLDALEARQTPDAEKRRRADFVVHTGLGKRDSLRALTRIVRLLRDAQRQDRCGKSFSIPKRRGWKRGRAIASSRSPASSS